MTERSIFRAATKGVLGMAAFLLLAAVTVAAWFFIAIEPRPVDDGLSGSVTTHQLEIEGRERTYRVYRPAELAAEPALVFILHGSTLNTEMMRRIFRYRFSELADTSGHVLVFPEGWKRQWNGCRDAPRTEAHMLRVDDVGFLTAVALRESARFETRGDKIFAAGFSNGGQMAYRLATEAPDVFSRVAAIAAQQPVQHNSRCLHPRGPVSVLVMNGTADPLVPFAGGVPSFYGLTPAGEVQAMEGTVSHWLDVNAMPREPDHTMLGSTGEAFHSPIGNLEWLRNGVVVRAVVIPNGGHTVPGGWRYAPEALVGPVNRDINAAEEIWDFFGLDSDEVTAP